MNFTNKQLAVMMAAVGAMCLNSVKSELRNNYVGEEVYVNNISNEDGVDLYRMLKDEVQAGCAKKKFPDSHSVHDNRKETFYVPVMEKVISSDPATIVFWKDGSKTIVKCQNGEPFDAEKGIALCYMKKALGNKYEWYNTMKRCMRKAGTKVQLDTTANSGV